MLTATHSRRVAHFTGLVTMTSGTVCEMQFSVDAPISAFAASELPEGFESVEIVGVTWETPLVVPSNGSEFESYLDAYYADSRAAAEAAGVAEPEVTSC